MCLAAHRGLNTEGCFIEGINAGQRGEVALSSLKKTLASDQGELTKRDSSISFRRVTFQR